MDFFSVLDPKISCSGKRAGSKSPSETKHRTSHSADTGLSTESDRQKSSLDPLSKGSTMPWKSRKPHTGESRDFAIQHGRIILVVSKDVQRDATDPQTDVPPT